MSVYFILLKRSRNPFSRVFLNFLWTGNELISTQVGSLGGWVSIAAARMFSSAFTAAALQSVSVNRFSRLLESPANLFVLFFLNLILSSLFTRFFDFVVSSFPSRENGPLLDAHVGGRCAVGQWAICCWFCDRIWRQLGRPSDGPLLAEL